MGLSRTIEGFDRAVLGLGSWRDALGDYATAVGAHVGQIAGIDGGGTLIINMTSGVSDEQVAEYVASGGPDPRVNPRTRAMIEAVPLRTIGESDFADRDTIRDHPYYRTFFTRHELPFCALTKLIHTPQAMVGVALLRSAKAGHVSDEQRRFMDKAAPRLARAVNAGLTLECQKIDLVGGTLDQLTIPVFALTAGAQIVRMSAQAEALLATGRPLRVTAGALAPVAAEVVEPFRRAVAALHRARPQIERCGTTFALPAPSGSAVRAELIPLPADSNGWLHAACCLLAVRPAAEVVRPNLTLSGSYGLTRAECEIADLILQGFAATMIAELRGVSPSTVRNQIKSVLAKTGCRRQIDLVRRWQDRG